MELEKRCRIRKAILKKNKSEIDNITKEELLEYIVETNNITINYLNMISNNV